MNIIIDANQCTVTFNDKIDNPREYLNSIGFDSTGWKILYKTNATYPYFLDDIELK